MSVARPSARRFALLVGVSDYSAFDASAGQPRGSSDLFGPAQNLAAMWDFCQGLGYSAADIGLLASPLVPPRGGHPAMYAAATRAAVLDGVRTLADLLAATDESQALIYFSGHGDEVEGVGPVLCTEDTTVGETGLSGVVSLAEIAEVLTTRAPGKAVTLILDSCGSGTPSPRQTRTLGRMRGLARLRDGDTLISATPAGGVGVEILVDGVWRGALTWALCTAAAPYARTVAGGFVVPDLSLGSWIHRARLLLRGVSVYQRPELRGDASAVVLQPSGVPAIPVTDRLADQRRGGIEIYGDEGGQVYGDEAIWVTFTIHQPYANGAVIGSLVTSYQTPTTTIAPYSDFWVWQGTAWPTTFKMEFGAIGTAGVNTPPSNLPAPMPMMAFPPGMKNKPFSTQSTSGYEVWGIAENSVPEQFLGYLLKSKATGALTWLITKVGYTDRGHYLSALPNPNGVGGVELGDDSEALWFAYIDNPPETLTDVLVAYNVYQAWAN